MKFDKQELEKKIRDAKDLSNEDKSNLLQLLKEKKTYGLVWEDSTEDAWEKMKESIPVLKEDETKQILHGSENPNHILIEGDNLNALVALTYTHAGMIDVMYLDPPYNTGNKDFVYNDCIIDKEDEFRHSKWLSFMNKRLKIAKSLLSDNGIMMISIDNHEFSNLKLLCDEIFGEQHLVTIFVWETEGHTDNQEQITDVHEYILCYSKSGNYALNNIVDPNVDVDSKILRDFAENSITKNGIKNPPSEILLPIGFPCESDELKLSKSNRIEEFVIEARKNKYISRELTAKYNMVYPARLDPMIVEGGKLIAECRVFSGWASASKLKAFMQNNCNPIEDKNTILKYYLSKNGVLYYKREGRESHYVQTILRNLGTTETNKYMLEKMGVIFDYPKPVELITFLLSLFTKKDSVILDFFAGSGTTLHATMLLNKDGGKRQCISVTNNESQICEKNYKRNSIVINKDYESPKGEKEIALKRNNLRYYKVKMVDRKQNHQHNKELVYDLKDLLCIKDNLYKESNQFGTLSLKGKEKMIRYFAENGREVLLVYDTRVIPFIVKEIEKMGKKELLMKFYIFADGAYPYTQDFRSVLDKVDLIPLPYAYHRAIKYSLPDSNQTWEDNVDMTEEEKTELMAEAIKAENNENN